MGKISITMTGIVTTLQVTRRCHNLNQSTLFFFLRKYKFFTGSLLNVAKKHTIWKWVLCVSLVSSFWSLRCNLQVCKSPIIGGSTAVSCGRESQRTEHGGHLGGSQQGEWDGAELSWFPASSTVGMLFYYLMSPKCPNRDCYFHLLRLIHFRGGW